MGNCNQLTSLFLKGIWEGMYCLLTWCNAVRLHWQRITVLSGVYCLQSFHFVTFCCTIHCVIAHSTL